MLLVASILGIRSFGGPVAHLAYFRREYVERRAWVDERTFGELVALCQFLPGPASSELGIAIGLLRAGPLGAFAAWLGFTFPSFILLLAFALLFDQLPFEAGWVFPMLELVALVVVALAVWRMARTLTPDVPRRLIALAVVAAVLVSPTPAIQIPLIVLAALVGWRFLPAVAEPLRAPLSVPIGRRVAVAFFALYLALLLGLPIARALAVNSGVSLFGLNGGVVLFDAFYRPGALVFGGGHVVLPLLRAEIPQEWVSDQRFFAGYGAAQLVPGPLFTFAAYLGAVIAPIDHELAINDVWPPHGIVGALVAMLAIFLPAFLLVFAALPSWGTLRARPWAQSALRGVNAAVVGLLLAALVTIARAIASTLI